MSKNWNIQTLPLDGGCISFDFVNTIHSRVDDDIYDYIETYDDLIEWMERLKLLPAEKLGDLKKLVRKDEKAAHKALAEIKKNRETLYNFFSPVIHKKSPDNKTIKRFNRGLSDSLSQIAFNYRCDTLMLDWSERKLNLYGPLKIIYKDAFDIITTIPKNRLKECRSCGWLFIDRSKNNSRTWCNMQTCGSIEKAKRYYYRKKENN
jgi:predicted RNA-binding Zn ribbon-like protein